MTLNSAIMELLCACRSMGRTDGRSDFNRLSAWIPVRLEKENNSNNGPLEQVH